MMRKCIALLLTISCTAGTVAAYAKSAASIDPQYQWAQEGVTYCLNQGIIQGMENGVLALGDNLTKAQMAKMLATAFELSAEDGNFEGISQSHWAYPYLLALKKSIVNTESYKPDEKVTREEFTATLVQASGLKPSNIRNSDILSYNFSDYKEVSEEYKKLMGIAVERGYFTGSDGVLRPKDLLTRAEACTLLYRVKGILNGTVTPVLGVKQSQTPMMGSAACTVDEAKAWAKERGAHERFINIADLYWKYGELTGVRPDVLYAQAGKETAFGNYGGAVLPEMNNWAGIKKYGQNGDATEDHESFATPEDGVRAHFNHMGAYIGLQPIGEVHGRYQSVKSLSWAGTVKYVEELGGKWCPDLYYGYSILHNYVEKMSSR